LSPPILALDNVEVGYEPGRPVLRRVTLRIDDDDRIALLGANGNGKSTLAKLLADRLPPMQGKVTRADKLSIGYFAQHQLDELDQGASAYQHLRRMLPDAPEATVRARAGAIGFPGAMADTPAAQLSGGEKARLMMGMATFGGPHLVILDEPTNHLDIDSRAALIEAINGYTGAVILVSHDRYLLEACADRLWLVAGGGVAPFDGDLDDYRRFVLSEGTRERATAAAAEAKTSRTDLRRAAAEKRSELAPLRRRITTAEAAIEKLTIEIARLDVALADGLFERDPGKAATVAKARADAAAQLAGMEEDWLAASAEYEQAMA
jgi:ATP-binding cassette subfamily F protein 3